MNALSLRQIIASLVSVLAVAMAGSHAAQVVYLYMPTGQFKNFHIGFSLILVFLIGSMAYADRKFSRVALIFLSIIAVIPLIYIHFNYTLLTTERVFGPTSVDIYIGTLLVTLLLIATWLAWGALIPIFCAIVLLYAYFGPLFGSGIFFHGGMSYGRIVGYSSIPLFQGALGGLTGLSAGTIFIYMLFAGLLKAVGGVDFVMTFARALGGRSRSGPAQVAVIGSGLMGMISGSSVANVASTGAFTIPLMKQSGFSPRFAGAIEAVASTGGQFMPPVMGLTAFLIVGLTGIPYNEIMLAALFPALLYYGYLIVSVHLRACKDGIVANDEGAESLSAAVLRYGHILIAITVLVYQLVVMMPPAYAALNAIVAIIALELVRAILIGVDGGRRQALKGAFVRLYEGVKDGACTGASLAVIIAVVGIIVDILVAVGFAQKLSHLIVGLSDGSLSMAIAVTAVACLVFGLGLPTSAAYILVALTAAPAMVEIGIPVLAAHLFVFYFATMSGLTPPIALASLVGARIAGADYIQTSIVSVGLALPGYILPVMFVTRPEILLLSGNWTEQLGAIAAVACALFGLTVALVGYGYGPVSVWARLLSASGALAMIVPGLQSTAIGFTLIAVAILTPPLWQRLRTPA